MTDIEKLIQQLKSSKAGDRFEACEELRLSPELTSEAIAALRTAANDSNQDVVGAARRALIAHASPPPEPSVPAKAPTKAPAPTYSGMILASELLNQPSILNTYFGKYLFIFDQTRGHPKFDNLNMAICLAADRGWKAIDTATLVAPGGFGYGMMYVLLERSPEGQASQ